MDAPSFGSALMDHSMLGNVLEGGGHSAFLDCLQGANTFTYDHCIRSILWRSPAFVHDSGLMPVVIIWKCSIGRVAKSHEAMGIFVAPMVSIVQWSNVLVCHDSSKSIWSGAMHEMHLAALTTFTSKFWLIWKVEMKHDVFMIVGRSLWLVCKLLEGANHVLLVAG